jgi:formyl-CoA transferase
VRRRDSPGGSGRGEVVDVSLYDAMLRFQASHIVDYTLNGVVKDHVAAGSSPSVVSPSALYKSRDGRWLAIVSTRGGMFERFKHAVGGEWPTGPVPRDVVEEKLAAWLAEHDAGEAVDLLNEAGVCSSLVSTVADLVEDPHIQTRGDLVEVKGGDGMPFLMPGVIPRIGLGPDDPVRWTGQLPGTATDAVLGERLGLTTEQIEELRADGVV